MPVSQEWMRIAAWEPAGDGVCEASAMGMAARAAHGRPAVAGGIRDIDKGNA